MRKFTAIVFNEVQLNSRRVAPYALMILFSALAVMGWARGPAVAFGWATNSDFYIARSLKAYSFLFGVPIFNAMIMGDAIIRDFRFGIDPLTFSKPLSRAQYLFGKFTGNFLVLICSIATYPLTMLALQILHPSQMVVQPFKVLPYFTHFLFFVVVTQLAFAALFFMVGTLTRNNKIVYFLAISFYPVFIALLLFLASGRGKILLDPFLLNSGPSRNGFGNSAEYLNQYVYTYTPDMIWNRVGLILIAVACLTFVYLRFTITERSRKTSAGLALGLSTASEGVYYTHASPAQFVPTGTKAVTPAAARGLRRTFAENAGQAATAVITVNEGFTAHFNKLIAAVGVEFRLLRGERSLVIVMPLAIFLSLLEVAFYSLPPDISHSAAYAGNTATSLLIFLIGMAVFYTGEAMHRDREVRIEPFLWTTPVPNSVLILSRFISTLLLLFALIVSVGVTAVVIQIFRGHAPIDLLAYLRVYGIVLLPGTVFVTAVSVFLNVVLRNKYLAYVISIGSAVGLYYLYSLGKNHWSYNPVLYGLWNYADLTNPTNLRHIVLQRLYVMAIAFVCLLMAHLFFERKSSRERGKGSFAA
jgi:ABC-2 type transport system permease protein